jgi:threonine synthase
LIERAVLNDWILKCPSCMADYAIGTGLFGCPGRNSRGEHLLRRMLAAGEPTVAEMRTAWGSGGGTFNRLHPLVTAWRLAGEAGYGRILDRLSEELIRLEGHGFEVTPLAEAPALGVAIGRSGRLWVKDETGNVGGSHKGRHLMATLLYMEALRGIGPAAGRKILAIYSCGNAALAASAVARAGGYELHAFVPPEVDPVVAGLLVERGAIVEKIERSGTGEGDPCYLAFQSALSRSGWLPFACAGNENWSNIEGGSTLGWELVLQLRDRGEPFDHVVIQVGGGALARAVAQALEEAEALGLLSELPRIHVCQPEGGFPFVRAWLLALAAIARVGGIRFGLQDDPASEPVARLGRFAAFGREPGRAAAAVEFVRSHFGSAAVQAVLADIAREPCRIMWAWDGPAPHSLAHGILDDVTYDWYHLLRAVLRTGGRAEILSEDSIARAHALARQHTGIRVCPTGAAGLAGLIQLTGAGVIAPQDSAALFFTGFDRAAPV